MRQKRGKMTAKEMFKELGYKKYLNKYDRQAKKDWGCEVFFRYRKNNFEVAFDCLDMDYCVYARMLGMRMDASVGIELHKAIHKQIEELGWLE